MNPTLANNLTPEETVRYAREIPEDALVNLVMSLTNELERTKKKLEEVEEDYHAFALAVESNLSQELPGFISEAIDKLEREVA